MSAAGWGESVARALRLVERLADHIERKRAAHRAAVAKKASIDARHVPPEKSRYARSKS